MPSVRPVAAQVVSTNDDAVLGVRLLRWLRGQTVTALRGVFDRLDVSGDITSGHTVKGARGVFNTLGITTDITARNLSLSGTLTAINAALSGSITAVNATLSGFARGPVGGYTQLLGPVNSLNSGVPPSAATTPFLLQADTVAPAYVTGGVPITFNVAFPSGLATVVCTPGDIVGATQIQLKAVSSTRTGFAAQCFQVNGVEFPNGSVVRLNYIALGW